MEVFDENQGEMFMEVDDRGLLFWRDPNTGWKLVPPEERRRVGASEQRVKTAPRYKTTVRRFLARCSTEQSLRRGSGVRTTTGDPLPVPSLSTDSP